MKSIPKFVTLLLALLVVVTGAGCDVLQGSQDQALEASGVIEATEITVAAELSGRVMRVAVDQGDVVKEGDALFRLDDTLLRTQRRAAATALESARAGVRSAQVAVETAQAQLDLTLSQALFEERLTRLETWTQASPTQFDQPAWYFTKEERIQSTQAELAAARQALDEAEANLANIRRQVGSGMFLEAEERLSRARIAFQSAADVLARTTTTGDNQRLRDAAQDAFDEAERELEEAQEAYDETLTTEGAQDVLEARADLAVARERFNVTMDAMQALQTGANSPAVNIARKAVDLAKTNLEQAQSAVSQASASLALIDAQIEKLTVYSPLDGVVLTRSIQPGEVLQAGMSALTIAKLENLNVTVYISEDRYGEINLGAQATLSVDSFPGRTFTAVVTRISDRAEYTPRNVQTKEQRQTTVYAVQLSVENVDGRLKPGMPVDVTFAIQTGR